MHELAVCCISFAKLLVIVCYYPDTGILKVSFWSLLSNTKNGANFNLPTPYGRTTIHEKLSASGRSGGGETNPLTRALPMDHAGVSAPIPSYRIYGWMTLTKRWVPICLYCSNCTKFGQLILRKIIKIVATRCQILRLKYTKFDFGWGFTPDPAGEAYSAPPDLLVGFGDHTSKGREREEEGGGDVRGGREGKGRGLSLLKINFQVTLLLIIKSIRLIVW